MKRAVLRIGFAFASIIAARSDLEALCFLFALVAIFGDKES